MSFGQEMWYSDWVPWTPGPTDAGQVEECSRERAVFELFADTLPEDEKCARALRAMEVDRVATETRRAAASLVSDQLRVRQPAAVEAIRGRILRSRSAVAIAALNLMGIQTLLPGEAPFGVADMVVATQIYLREFADWDTSWPLSDSLDALGGLIGDFQRATIFVNGLRIQPIVPSSDPLVLVAAHSAILAAFGEFLGHKYITEGWSLT